MITDNQKVFTNNQTPDSEWMKDPRIASIPKNKLEFLQKMFFESQKLSKKELMPFLMALAGRAKKEKITFEQSEVDLILSVIKENATPEECQKIDQTLRLFSGKK